MRTGIEWSEASYTGSPLQRLNECGCDWLRFVRWQGHAIVSPEWIRASTARTVPSVRSFGSYGFDYGYLWWMTGTDVIAAIGAHGQWLLVSPSARLVMAVTGMNDNVGNSPVAFLYSHVLPAISQR